MTLHVSRLFTRFHKTDEALSDLVWPEKFHQGRFELEKRRDEKFKSRLRFQISHEDFRQRISQDEEDINSILDWYKLTDSVFLGIIIIACSVKYNSFHLKSLQIICLRRLNVPTVVLFGVISLATRTSLEQ